MAALSTIDLLLLVLVGVGGYSKYHLCDDAEGKWWSSDTEFFLFYNPLAGKERKKKEGKRSYILYETKEDDLGPTKQGGGRFSRF